MLKKVTITVILCLMVLILAVFFPQKQGDNSINAASYYSQIKNPPLQPVEWMQKGRYITWKSQLPENGKFKSLNIFTVSLGEKNKPAILLLHGYPTSSYDFYKLAGELQNDFYLCLIDTPGYGFSDKPHGYHYSLSDDADLIDYAIRNCFELQEFSLLTHDKGDSVGLALLEIYQAYKKKPYQIKNHFILNGNLYLPLAELTRGQKILLNPVAGKILSLVLSGKSLAKGLTDATYSPVPGPEEINALASVFDYQSGTRIEHQLIQYLNERKVNEIKWLETLQKSEIPTTLIWGEQDKIAPVRVADYIWGNYINPGKTPAAYWRVPLANHYIQYDQPGILAEIIKFTSGAKEKPDFSRYSGIPYLVDNESAILSQSNHLIKAMKTAPDTIHSRFIKVNNMRFHVLYAGPANGEPVILLHGFPDAGFGWDRQIQALAKAGYFVIAPDQRGYNLSDKPAGKTNYMMNNLTADIIGIADFFNIRKFYLAGHDFGALVSWNLADKHPERIMKMAVLNVPHPKVMNDFVSTNNEQLSKSWYAFFFRIPVIPEIIIGAFDWKMLSSAMAGSFTKEELMRYKAAWSQKGSISAMINWYRCIFLQPEHEKPRNKIKVPTLIIWGKKDPHLMWQMVPGSAAMCDTSRIVYFDDATHWVQQEKPDEVSRLLIEHFK